MRCNKIEMLTDVTKMSKATFVLQKFAGAIKQKSTKHLVKKFAELRLTKINVENSMTFEQLVTLLRTENVIQTGKHAFQRLLLLAALMDGEKFPNANAENKIKFRVILAMYMIVCFPGERDYSVQFFRCL